MVSRKLTFSNIKWFENSLNHNRHTSRGMSVLGITLQKGTITRQKSILGRNVQKLNKTLLVFKTFLEVIDESRTKGLKKYKKEKLLTQ